MADILIKGIEMPEIKNNHGIKAEIRMIDGKLELGIMTGGYYCSQEWTYYPLVEISDHGRLIDADALEASCFMGSSSFYTQSDIDYAPTIIPAEEGET